MVLKSRGTLLAAKGRIGRVMKETISIPSTRISAAYGRRKWTGQRLRRRAWLH
jgi:hypothetical protein